MNDNKNILIITGSPRKNGNSELLADAFIRGAQNAGHLTTKFQAGKKNIRACIACNKCYTKGKACIFNDDFNSLAPLIENADVIVFSTPLYWFSFPAQIKTAIDKIYALFIGKRDIKIKECVLLVCAETGDMNDFDGIVRSYELIYSYTKWTNRGIQLVPHVNEEGDILRTDALVKAEEFGRKL